MKATLLSLLIAVLAVPGAWAQDHEDRGDRAAERIERVIDRLREIERDLEGSHEDRVERALRLMERSARRAEDAEFDEAADLMDDAADLVEDVRDDLRDDGYDGRADRLSRVLWSMRSLEGELDDAEHDPDAFRDRREDRWEDRADRWERAGERWEERAERWGERWEERAEKWAERWEDRADEIADRWDDDEDEDWEKDYRDRRDEWRRHRFRSYAPAFVGDFGDRWPFMETASYRPISSIRYNRVDGLTLGVRRRPMDWDSYDRARVFGQVSRAFGLDEWRYEIGGEARLGHAYRSNDFDVKVGGAYRMETATNDLWKASWGENSAAAFFFRTDLFDYYQTEGFTLYAQARMTPLLQATVAYRSDDYTSLDRNASWALFGGDDFRVNPRINEGRMQSVVAAVDGGKVRGLRWIPSGVAFRAEAEFGEGLGGDFNFTRYVGDVRGYFRLASDAGLALRVRGGTSQGDLPIQKSFTLGGAGSVRAYPQNIFRGSEMVLANAELTFYDVDPLDGILGGVAMFGLLDAGWVNGTADRSFEMDDVIPAAGFGVAFDDRQVRLELAWPLRDMGTGLEPTLWLRLNPTF